MRRVTAALALVAAVATNACGGGATTPGTPSAAPSSAAQPAATSSAQPASTPTKLTLWVGFTNRELGVVQGAVKDFEASHPGLTVNVVGGINDDKITAMLRGGDAPDAVSSFTSANVGAYCGSGGWVDLAPYLQKDGIDAASILTPATQYYTQYKGVRCALPMLADAYGLTYNKKLFAAAGITSPPKTISEFTVDAQKLTTKNADGSLGVVGFDPLFGFYQNTHWVFATMFGAKWTDANGKSTLSSDPGWAKMLTWQKGLVDWFGHDKLVKWQTGAGDEFSAANAFENGKLAMAVDGEWRVAFVQNEHPDLDYGVAPVPVDDTHPELYGSGAINGTIIGIPHNAPHPDLGWELVKYLTTNDHALATMSNGLRNVPSTKSSLTSSELIPDDHFKVFLDVFGNPASSTSPITAVGSAYQELFTTFVTKWQAGQIPDLNAGLQDVDKQIDDQLAQAGG